MAAGRLRRWRFLQRRRAYRRHRRGNTRGLGAKTQLLKGFRIELPRRIQPMRFLKFPRCFNGWSVPLAVRCSCERTVFRERLLDLGYAVGSRGLLSPLPTLRSFRGLCPMRRAARLGRGGFLLCRALRFRRTCTYTQPRCYEQRQGQVGSYSRSHRRGYWLSLRHYCWLSAGTLPDR